MFQLLKLKTWQGFIKHPSCTSLVYLILDIYTCCWAVTAKQAMKQQFLLDNSFINTQEYQSHC
jgi:hypothetical protein